MTRLTPSAKTIALHVGVVLLLLALNFLLPEYHRGVFARVLVLAVFAMGYNLAFGYTGLLSLGHAMFFAAGLYGAGLTIYHLEWSVWPAFGTGAAYAVLFGYVGSGFAAIQYSILPLLWVLVGGAATTLGPLIGTLFMFYVIDTASSYTTAHLLVVGLVLIGVILFFPKGITGTVRERWLPWLP